MGIRGLQTYIAKFHPSCLEEVSLESLVPPDPPGKLPPESRNSIDAADPFSMPVKAYLILDGCNLMGDLYHGTTFTKNTDNPNPLPNDRLFARDLDWIRGGQMREYVDNLRYFVRGFRACGIRIVAFFDGTGDDQKLEIWERRRRDDASKVSKVFSLIDTHLEIHKTAPSIQYVRDVLEAFGNGGYPPEPLYYLPVQSLTLTTFAYKYECDTPVVVTLGDADRYMVFGALHPLTHLFPYIRDQLGADTELLPSTAVLGVMSRDSDFYLYPGLAYFPAQTLSYHSMRVSLFDRAQFCRRIGLNHLQSLPLLGTLIGNDFTLDSAPLKSFHARLCDTPHRLISLVPALVRFINERYAENIMYRQFDSDVERRFYQMIANSMLDVGGNVTRFNNYNHTKSSECWESVDYLVSLLSKSVSSYSTSPIINRCLESQVDEGSLNEAFFDPSIYLGGPYVTGHPVDTMSVALRCHMISHVPSALYLCLTSRVIRNSVLLERTPSDRSSLASCHDIFLSVRQKHYSLLLFPHHAKNYVTSTTENNHKRSRMDLTPSTNGEIRVVRECTFDRLRSRTLHSDLVPLPLWRTEKNGLDLGNDLIRRKVSNVPLLGEIWTPLMGTSREKDDVPRALLAKRWECLVAPFVTHFPGSTDKDIAEEYDEIFRMKRMFINDDTITCADDKELNCRSRGLIHLYPQYVPVILVLYYMKHSGPRFNLTLQEWEIDAFIIQAVCLTRKPHCEWEKTCFDTSESLNFLIDGKAIQLATIFNYGVKMFMMVLAASGFPVPMKPCLPWNYFDGKLFHLKYLQVKHLLPLTEVCAQDNDIEEDYAVLRDIIRSS